MRLLLIDTGTKQLDGLRDIYAKHELDIVKAEDFSIEKVSGHAIVVVCGDYGQEHSSDAYQDLASFMQTGDIPVVGVGVGFELVCRVAGAELDQLADLETAAPKIMPTDDGAKVFQGSDPLCVVESKRWNIDELPKKLSVLARSETGIEAVRHKTLPLYGIQLLPKDFTYPSDAKMVFENLLAVFKLK